LDLSEARPEGTRRVEWLKCRQSPAYFLHEYVQIFNATEESWVPFRLWPAQGQVVRVLQQRRQVIILKARQLGMTWLCLGWALHGLVFRTATVLLFSRRDDEAMELLSDERLKGMYSRLPRWMQCRAIAVDNAHEWILSNGSRALAFPTTAGDSYTANLVIVDEADLVPNLNRLMRSVKPTVDNGGQIVLLSRADKEQPMSEFKQLYRAAKAAQQRGEREPSGRGWAPVFLPWSAHPGRSQAWYEAQRQDAYARTGSYDDLYEQYPATDDQALAPQQKGKRIAYDALVKVSGQRPETSSAVAVPALPGLAVFEPPRKGRSYVIGGDPAEGNPDSDDSGACVVDAESWAQAAVLSDKLGTAAFTNTLRKLAAYFNDAGVMVERNNHGHAILLGLLQAGDTQVILGLDGKPGWASSERGKTLMYDLVADTVQAGDTVIYDETTREQLASIEANTLRAPEGLHDDRADAYALALVGLRYGLMSSSA